MVIFMDFYGIEGSVVLGLIFYGFHRFYLSDFRWICVDFMDSWGPSSDGVWQNSVTESGPYC